MLKIQEHLLASVTVNVLEHFESSFYNVVVTHSQFSCRTTTNQCNIQGSELQRLMNTL